MSSIHDLIGEAQRLVLARRYLEELRIKITEEDRNIARLREQLSLLQKDLDKVERKGLLRLFVDLTDEKKAQAEALRAEYLQNAKELNEAQEVAKLLRFEKRVLEEKIAREDEVRTQLEEAVQQRSSEFKENSSPFLRELLTLFARMDDRSALRQEIAEIIRGGQAVLEHIEKIDLELKHNLVRSYQTQQYEKPGDGEMDGFAITSRRVVTEVKAQATQMKASLEAFRRELDDVFDDRGIRLAYSHKRSAYYKTISYAESITREFLQNHVSQMQRHPLKKIVEDIEEMNALFTKEQHLLDQELQKLKNEKDRLLSQGA